MFDAWAPLNGPLNYSNPTSLSLTHTHVRRRRWPSLRHQEEEQRHSQWRIFWWTCSVIREEAMRVCCRDGATLPLRCYTQRLWGSKDSSAEQGHACTLKRGLLLHKTSKRNEDFQPFSLRLVSGECTWRKLSCSVRVYLHATVSLCSWCFMVMVCLFLSVIGFLFGLQHFYLAKTKCVVICLCGSVRNTSFLCVPSSCVMFQEETAIESDCRNFFAWRSNSVRRVTASISIWFPFVTVPAPPVFHLLSCTH